MSLPFILLIIANCFMTLAWYGHLKFLPGVPLWQAILFSWFIALVEYSFMIPATRMLSQQGWSMGEMKITQEVVTLLVFVPFMLFLFKQPFKLDYLWAGLFIWLCVFCLSQPINQKVRLQSSFYLSFMLRHKKTRKICI